MKYYFEWDPNKARQNIRNHKTSFERAATVFLDQRALSIFDDEHSKIEERWLTLGIDDTGILLVVCHTFNQIDNEIFNIRIISTRKATKNETKQYEESLK